MSRMKKASVLLAVALPSVLLAAPTLVPAPRQATYGQGVFEGPVEARAVAERTIVRDAALPADGRILCGAFERTYGESGWLRIGATNACPTHGADG